MTPEQLQNLLTNMGTNIQDQAVVSDGLLQLKKHIEEITIANADLTKNKADLEQKNEDLRKVNMNFMLELGKPAQNSPDPVPEQDPTPDPSAENTLKISDLFNDKGELI